jgi:TRAP-type C4-dicarboxylate transport system permease small subunit
LRRFLDRLYAASGALAAFCLASIAAVMLLQSAMREAGFLLRGADDVVAWLCAASAFLAYGYTFRLGEMVRVSLVLEKLRPAARRRVEHAALGIAVLFAGYLLWAVAKFVHESWRFGEVAQGLLRVPIWIPQLSLVIGALIFFVAVLDEFVTLLTGGLPAYRAAEEAHHRHPDPGASGG